MTDTNLTLLPFSTFSCRLAYSHSTMEGPDLSPSYTILKYNALLRQYERNGNDNFLGAIDWKPSRRQKSPSRCRPTTTRPTHSLRSIPPDSLCRKPTERPPTWAITPALLLTASRRRACNTTSMGSGLYQRRRLHNPFASESRRAACRSSILHALWSPATRGTRRPASGRRLKHLRYAQLHALKNIIMNGNFHYTAAP